MKRIKRKEVVYVTLRGPNGRELGTGRAVRAVQIGDGRLLAETPFHGSIVCARGDWRVDDVDRRGRRIDAAS